ncbi:Nicotinate phosphoribosyltransferase [Clostridiaceae bacterium JG1575]|nr:Nicotinate phosphoribosyltransferase [Clostridiaceae bacterium JG1575]
MDLKERRFNVREPRNLTMLTDFYELTMGNGYLDNNMQDRIAYFDMYFRRIPDDGGYGIMAGVQQLIEYINELGFTEEDITYLQSLNLFSAPFIDFLRTFRFTCDVYAIPEGTPVFPNEPLVTVRGPVMQAQLLETMVLLTINHQTLIATKSSRIVRAAEGRGVMEFGSRRAQGYDGATYGARAAVIAGCIGTANTMAGMMFDIPVSGTMAHSWIQMFDSEYEAFKAYAKTYPDQCTLLVDTYNTLKSGIPNAIRVFNEVVVPKGHRPRGIRIDSGDITYLTKEARVLLDEAGFSDVKILVSNSLDEFIIRDVLSQGACIDGFGVGERLITAKSEPVFGGVYKLVAVDDEMGRPSPRIKLSENEEKITTPGFKKIYRIFSQKDDLALADVICHHDEVLDEQAPLTIFDPIYTWKKKTLRHFYAKQLQVQIFKQGRCVYESPSVKDIAQYSKGEMNKFWDEVKRLENPHKYYVDLSKNLWQTKQDLLNELTDRFAEME